MKRLISLLIAVITISLSFTACSSRGFSLKINDTSVPEGVFNYYLSAAENDKAYKDKKDKNKTALELCKKYTAENEMIKKYKISLSAEEKVAVSEDTKAQWLYYKNFYNRYSVSKQTLNLILEHEQLVEDTIIAAYSENSKNPLSEKEIKKFFDKNYIAVQIISADFTDENGNPSDDATVSKITTDFTEMRNAVLSGESMESAVQKYPEFAEYEGEASIISSFDTSYPTGLFNSVITLKKGDAQVYKYKQFIYLIHRLDDASDDIYYSLYEKECIIRMKKADFEKNINTIAQSYEMVYNIL